MDHREHRGRQDQDFRRDRDFDQREPRGRASEEASFGQPGQSGYGEATYAQGELSRTSGRGPQALGQGGHMRSHEGDFGYTGAGPNQYGYGYGAPEGSRGHDAGQGGYETSRNQGGGYSQGGPNQRDFGVQGGYSHGGYPSGDTARGSQGGGQGRSSGQGVYGGAQNGGGDIGFGQGGAFQQGWGGQSDSQRHDMGQHDHPNRPGDGGGTYGQGQFGSGARRSEYRDDQRYSGGLHQDQNDRGGFSGVAGGRDHDHEPDYHHYKSQRLADLDREHHERRSAHERELDDHYNEFREHKRTKFSREFEDWRSQRQSGAQNMSQGSSGGNTGANLSGATGSDRDEERSRSLSSPGGSDLPTDKTGVGDLNPAAPGGGAGMKGAGAVGGSPTTAAVGSAGAGAPNPSTGADTSGVTTGSENASDKRH